MIGSNEVLVLVDSRMSDGHQDMLLNVFRKLSSLEVLDLRGSLLMLYVSKWLMLTMQAMV